MTSEAKFEKFVSESRDDWRKLIAALIAEIDDDYRAPDCELGDDTPSMQITIACNDDCESWGWQSGDNSYTGGAYGFQHWAVLYVTRDSDPDQEADDVASQLGDLLFQ